jgi:hypothetical protein
MRTQRRLSKAEGGNVLIEFALLAPVFFMLVMGLVEFVLFQYKPPATCRRARSRAQATCRPPSRTKSATPPAC